MHDAVCAVRLCMRVLRVSDYAVCIYLYAICVHLSHPLMKLGSNRKTEDSEKTEGAKGFSADALRESSVRLN